MRKRVTSSLLCLLALLTSACPGGSGTTDPTPRPVIIHGTIENLEDASEPPVDFEVTVTDAPPAWTFHHPLPPARKTKTGT